MVLPIDFETAAATASSVSFDIEAGEGGDVVARILPDGLRVIGYQDGDPFVRRLLTAVAKELDRLETAAEIIRLSFWPQNATDRYDILAMWETFFGLPVKQPGQSVASRQARVVAHLRSRRAGSGAAWVDTLTDAIGTNWWHDEQAELYRVVIHLPFPLGSDLGQQATNLARRITPAHLEVITVYGEGFILDQSLLSQDRL